MRAALARLTPNERECLRRRLLPQTAKEMAIDLGISPHAVEKRLKMARAKLGVTSSLEAARLLAAAEGYGGVVPQTPELSGKSTTPEEGDTPAVDVRRWGRHAIGGPMSLFLAVLVAALPQSSVPLPAAAPRPVPTSVLPKNESIETIIFRPASPDEVLAFVRDSFRTMDKDGSGYIECAEAPENGVYTGPKTFQSLIPIKGRIGRAMTIAQADTDDDGRISEDEFVASRLPIFLPRGVPANWRGEEMAAAAAAAASAVPSPQ